jgi:hypothetical protein
VDWLAYCACVILPFDAYRWTGMPRRAGPPARGSPLAWRMPEERARSTRRAGPDSAGPLLTVMRTDVVQPCAHPSVLTQLSSARGSSSQPQTLHHRSPGTLHERYVGALQARRATALHSASIPHMTFARVAESSDELAEGGQSPRWRAQAQVEVTFNLGSRPLVPRKRDAGRRVTPQRSAIGLGLPEIKALGYLCYGPRGRISMHMLSGPGIAATLDAGCMMHDA